MTSKGDQVYITELEGRSRSQLSQIAELEKECDELVLERDRLKVDLKDLHFANADTEAERDKLKAEVAKRWPPSPSFVARDQLEKTEAQRDGLLAALRDVCEIGCLSTNAVTMRCVKYARAALANVASKEETKP